MPFFENLGVSGAFEMEGDGPELEPSFSLGWGQRWVKDGGTESWVPTVALLTELNLPLGPLTPELCGENMTVTLTVAKLLGPGSLYVNGMLTGLLGPEEGNRGGVWGMRAGYKWNVIEDQFSVVADCVHEQSEDRAEQDLNMGELSLGVGVGEHLTLGPGLTFGADGPKPQGPRFGGGLVLVLE